MASDVGSFRFAASRATLALAATLVGCGSPAMPTAVGTSTARPVATEKRAQAAPSGETIDARATRLHREAIIVDGHNDIPSVLVEGGLDLATPTAETHTDLARMKAGGITAEFFSIYVDKEFAENPTARGGGPLRRALDLVDVTYRQIERHPNDLILATSAADILRAKKENKVAVLLGIEGGHAIENSLAALRELYRLGCRYMTLTHSNTNDWADSAGYSGPLVVRHHGLSPFGRDVVREMQRIGMLVDVSHTSDETFWATLEVARAPILVSHSSARAIADHRRNLSDDMLRAVAKNGGVVMVNFWPMFLSEEFQAASRTWNERHGAELAELRARFRHDPIAYRRARDELRRTTEPLPKVPLSVLVDHIEHVAKVAGIDHVGLGSDFDGVDELPEGLGSIADLPKLTRALVERGFDDDAVKKILGGNFLRVFEAAEQFAKATNTTLSGDGSRRRIDDPLSP